MVRRRWRGLNVRCGLCGVNMILVTEPKTPGAENGKYACGEALARLQNRAVCVRGILVVSPFDTHAEVCARIDV